MAIAALVKDGIVQTDALGRVINYDTDQPCGCCGEATGACCSNGGSCSVITSDECVRQRGVYQGDGTTCVGRICTGACCIGGVTCYNSGFGPCELNYPGSFKGIGTVCNNTICPTAGKCCSVPGTPCYWTAGIADILFTVSTTFTEDICCGGVKHTCTFTKTTQSLQGWAQSGCADATFTLSNAIGYGNAVPGCTGGPCTLQALNRTFFLQIQKVAASWGFLATGLLSGSGLTQSCSSFSNVYSGCLPSFTKTCTDVLPANGANGVCGGSNMGASAVTTWNVTFLDGLGTCGFAPTVQEGPNGEVAMFSADAGGRRGRVIGGFGGGPVVIPSAADVRAVRESRSHRGFIGKSLQRHRGVTGPNTGCSSCSSAPGIVGVPL